MSPEPEIHPATDALAAISSKVDQAAAAKAGLRHESCVNAHEWKGAVSRYVAAALSKDGDTARRSATQLYRYLRCVSAKDFIAVVNHFEEIALTAEVAGDEQIRGAMDEILAPLVFMLHDMGGRLAKRSYRAWLIARADQLLRAADNPTSFLSIIGMFGSYGDFLRLLSAKKALFFVTGLGAVSGRCAYFEMAQVNSEVSICPRDCDLFRNFEVAEGLDATLIGRQLNDLCKGYNASHAATSPELRGQVRGCVQVYAKEIGRTNVAACIGISSQHGRGVDGLYHTNFRRELHVLDDCSVAMPQPSASAKEQRRGELRADMSQRAEKLAELRRTQSELKDHYNRCIDFGHGEACSGTLGHALAVIDQQIRALELTKHTSQRQLGQLSATAHCRADGLSCSSQCGIAGQLLRDQERCYAATDGGQAPAPARHDSHDIPSKLAAKSPLKTLSGCLRTAFGGVARDTPLCNMSQLCADGSAPATEGSGCVCGPHKRAKLTRRTCETAITCDKPSDPCMCDDIVLSGVHGHGSVAPPTTRLLSWSP